MSKQQQLDPSIYQYDEIYEEIKAPKKTKPIGKDAKDKQQTQQGSKYIHKMKSIVEKRQQEHKRAKQRKQERDNQKFGIGQEEVFVTESYLKKKMEDEMLRKKEKEEEEQDIKNSVQDKTKSKDKMHDFRRKLLEDR